MLKTSTIAALGFAATLGLAACETATPYQPNVHGNATSGGYSEQKLEPNRWRVNFVGNTMTSRETVEGYLLYRAAELTLQNGDDWFAMVDRDTQRNARTYVEPDPFYNPWYGPGFGYWRPSWRYRTYGFGWRTWDPFWGDPFWGDRVDVTTLENFEASAEIVSHKGPAPAGDHRAFDAHAVVANLGPKIQYPEKRS
jgi:hypothetical protein